MKKYLPILQWFPKLTKRSIQKDAIAGTIVGIVLIPQGIAYALIAGLPPIYGLYTALLPQLVYAVLGTSSKIAIGPVATDSLIVAAAIASLSVTGPENSIAIALTLACAVGVLQLLMGFFKLGFVINFLSKPVISGFISAAAIIIALSQLRNFFGISIPRTNRIHELLLLFLQHLSEIHLPTFAIGATAILLMLLLKKINKNIPSPLFVVFLGIVLMKYANVWFADVAIVKEIPRGLPAFGLPNIALSQISEILPIALTLAIIGFLETVSIGKSFESPKDPVSINANQELIALGFANVLGSFFKAYPAASSFSRSSINKNSGAQTNLTAFFSVGVVALILLFFTPVFYYLPKTVLAAIIILSIVGLIDVKEALRLWKINKIDFWMLLVTFLGTLILGIKEGIGVGVGLSLLMVIFRTSKPHIAVLGRIPNTNFFRNSERFKDVEVHKEVLILRFDSHLYFANTNYFREQLDLLSKEKGTDLKLIVIDGECINGLDSTGAAMWNERIDYYALKGIQIHFTNIKGPVRDAMTKAGIISKIGIENCFMSNQGALDFYETGNRESQKKLSSYIEQSNN